VRFHQTKPRRSSLTRSELFANQFLDDELPITHCHMKTELVEGSQDLVYLYRSALLPFLCDVADGRLTPGKSWTSNAAECALAHGVPAKVVERAREVRYVRFRPRIRCSVV